ncbi:MAG: hypothetical protein ACI4RD_05935 [Kiritimatiellia bacterium]
MNHGMLALVGVCATACAWAEDAYVELTGSQAINTGYKAFYDSATKAQSQIELDFQLTEVPENGTRIIGGDGGNKGLSYFSLYADGNFKYTYNGYSAMSTGQAVTTDRYTVQLPAYGNAIFSSGGQQLAVSWIGMASGTMPNPIVLGANALNTGGSSISNLVAKMKIFGFRILERENGAWTRKYDFKPVVKGGSACLYDAATGTALQDDRGNALAWGGDIEELPEDGYVQSNGSSLQGINSRFCWQPGAKVEIDYALTDATKNTQYRMTGADYGGVGQRASIYVGGGGVSFGMGTDETGFKGEGTYIDPDLRRHTAVIDTVANKYYYRTGQTTEKTLTPIGVCTETARFPMGLMAGTTNENGSVFRHLAKMKLYGAKFYLNGQLVHDYVPCLKGDVAGLKDLVDGAFVTSGALTYGGDIRRENDDPYLENTDAVNYVDTGYKPTGKTKIVADFAFRKNTAQQFVFEGLDSEGVAFRQYINSGGNLAYRCSDGNNSTDVYVATGSPAVPARPFVRQRFTIDAAENRVIVENAGYTNWLAKNWISITATKSNQYTLKLFSSSDGKTNHADIRLYDFKLYDDGELKKHFVPYVMDGLPGLQDLVSGTFVTGKSNVAMRAYGEVACNKTEDAYLLSDGNQLINSGYFASYKSRIAIDYAFTDTTPARYQNRLFGQDYNVDETTMAFKTGWYINGNGKLAVGGGDNGAFNGTTFTWKTGYGSGECAADLTRYLGVLNFNNGKPSVALRTPEGTTLATATMSTSATYSQTSKLAMGLFGTATNNAFTAWRNLAKVKIYSVEIQEGGQVLHKYYPAKIGGKVGLYDLNGQQLHCNVTGSETDFVLGGAGYDGKGKDDGFLLKPAAAVTIPYAESATLTAFAPGAVEHRWTRNGEPVAVEGLALVVDWRRQRTTDLYSVTPVYRVNGLTVEGAPATTEVTYRPCGLSIIVR